MRNYSSQNGQGRSSPLRETAVLLAKSWRATDSLVRRQKIMGISLFKGGIEQKAPRSTETGPLAYRCIMLRLVRYFCLNAFVLYSLSHRPGSRMLRWSSSEPLCLQGLGRRTGRNGQTTYWLHRSIPFVILAHETLPNFSTSKIISNSLLTWG